ncbi:MAG TPA: HD domain-containing protein [archaeon]|nr:HD domain-containing protein [archaeon]
MLFHTDHLLPGMVLEKDIELKTGSFLITCLELGGGCLTEKVIKSIQNFSNQIVPSNNRVWIREDEFALNYIKNIIYEDLNRVAESVISGKDYTNFLADGELQAKVMRVMTILFSNPDIVRLMYDVKFNTSEQTTPKDLILEHSIRTALLSVALGLRLRWTILSLVSVGIAALLHDLGIFNTSPYPDLESLDNLPPGKLAIFVNQHQEHSASLFKNRDMALNPYQKKEVLQMILNHHNPDSEDPKHTKVLLFYLADLADEMVSLMPHRLRYNFSPAQLEILGEAYKRRCGLVNLLLGLSRLYKHEGGLAWEIVCNIAGLFKMKELISGDFDLKLKEIMDLCPFDSAKLNPPLEGNSLPRTLYCSRSNEKDFRCEHILYVKSVIQDKHGNIKEYFKCDSLGPRFQKLIEEGEG